MQEAAAAMPVVFATRTGAGTTMTSTYAFPGSETDLLARGVTAAGWLDPRKARLLLWSLLGAGAGRAAIAEQFAERGRCPSGGPRPALD
jgi:L-asparaginase